MFRWIIYLVCTVLLLLSGCSRSLNSDNPTEEVAGGSEIGNPTLVVSGTVVHPSDNQGVEGVSVNLRPSNYLAATSNSTSPSKMDIKILTNEVGNFEFKDLDFKDYIVEVNDGSNQGALRNINIDVNPDSIKNDSTVDLGQISLLPTGAIKGSLDLSGNTLDSSAYVQVYGTDHIAEVNKNTGEYEILDLPVGVYQLAFQTVDVVLSIEEIQVRLEAGDTTNVDPIPLEEYYANWNSIMTIKLNLPAGAPADTLINFPLMVKIDSLPDELIASNGADLRFSSYLDGALKFEIEHWDPVNKSAVIWVLIDTLYTHLEGQYYIMHWGKENVPNISNGEEVFGDFNYFGGVWHFDETQTGAKNLDVYKNSTSLENWGDDYITSEVIPSFIGNGVHLNRGDYIEISQVSQAMQPQNEISISAWVNPDSIDRMGGGIFIQGDNYGFRFTPSNGTDGNLTFWVYRNNVPGDSFKDYSVTVPNLMDGQWHHLQVNFNNSNVQYFVDGTMYQNFDFETHIDYDWWNFALIGRHIFRDRPNQFYAGSFDEIRMSLKNRPSAWIWLNYENQRPNSPLLSFE